MTSLDSWDHSFASLSLAVDGDDIEKEAVNRGMLSSFPKYELLWKLHVAPATLRPNGIQLRQSASKAMSSLAILSHSILGDLFAAALALQKLKVGEFGEGYRHALDAMSSDGDALQKFSEIQQNTIKAIGIEMGCALILWAPAIWKSVWSPRREKWILYRNNLTHFGRPFVVVKSGIHYVIHPDYLQQNMTWQEQEELLKAFPGKAAPLADVCELVHNASITWLNDAYSDLISFLAPLRLNPDYQKLWGWDLSKPGADAWLTASATAPAVTPPPTSLGCDISGKAFWP